MEATWIRENLLECRYKTIREMLDATYRFSHYHEYPLWRTKKITKEVLDDHYYNVKGDRDWWKEQWAGANLRDTDLAPFIAGDHGELNELETAIIDLVKDKQERYAIIMICDEALDVRDHEIAHSLFYLDMKYKHKVCFLIQSYWDELEAARAKLSEAYDEENLVDELHAYVGVYYHNFLFKLNITVPRKLRRELTTLFRRAR